MRLRELIFQGILGVDQATRLRPRGSFARLELPAAMEVDDVHDLLVACLYPKHLNADHRQRLEFEDSVKLAVVLSDTGHGPFRVIRGGDPGSVRLQRRTESGFDDVAAGATKVSKILHQKLHLPPLEVFYPLHLWRFDPEVIPELPQGSQFGDDPRIPELVDQYLSALEVEEVEDELKELETRLEEAKQSLGKGRKIEEKLNRARQKLDEIAVSELTDDDLEFLQSKGDEFKKFDVQLERLREQENDELDEIQRLLPESPVRNPRFWAGVVVAIAAWVASVAFHDTYRIVALAAVPGFALAGFELLQYFSNMGRAGVHRVRVESIRRRINQILEEQILYRDRVDHLLWRAGVENEDELQQRIPKATRLREGIEKLETKLESIRRDPDYQKARENVDAIEQRLEELKRRREDLPEFVMNSFQLENDLKSLGVEPARVLKEAEDDADTEKADDGADQSPFQRLRSVAEHTGQWNGDGLAAGARSTWSKICGHVLGDRFDDVDLSEAGRLQVGALTDEQLELWQNARASEVHAAIAALALALHVDRHRNGDERALESIWVGDLGEAMTPGHARKFESVFEKAGDNSQIVICEPQS